MIINQAVIIVWHFVGRKDSTFFDLSEHHRGQEVRRCPASHRRFWWHKDHHSDCNGKIFDWMFMATWPNYCQIQFTELKVCCDHDCNGEIIYLLDVYGNLTKLLPNPIYWIKALLWSPFLTQSTVPFIVKNISTYDIVIGK